jgi:hypothetical protein
MDDEAVRASAVRSEKGVLGIGKLGTGRDARFTFFQKRSVLHGGQFVLHCAPADAIALAVAQLNAEGFTSRDDNLDVRLREMGSPWLAQAVEIGETNGSWRRGFVAALMEDTPLEWFLQQRIPHTLVMVAARELPDSTTELVVHPHPSSEGDPGAAAGAEVRLRASYKAIAAACTADGTLVSHARSLGVANDGSPASQQMVGKLVGWE